jgi:hypothetical protein
MCSIFFSVPLIHFHCPLSTALESKKMSIDITLEDDDENFYYEVEEIIQMHVTDSGKRMFEIKWKNYDHS